jgi:predicted HTH domain antitoxin
MQVAIDLPDDFAGMHTEQILAKEMRLAYALTLFKQGRVSLAKAGELAGLNLYDFIAACKAERIEVIDTSREELVREMRGFSEPGA